MKQMMIVAFAVCILTASLRLNAGTMGYTLGVKGKVVYDDKGLADAVVSVFVDTTRLYGTYPSDERGIFTLQLPLQEYYVIKIYKKGFVTKIFTADTHLPKQNLQNYFFEITAMLFEKIPDLPLSVLKYPVAKITFNKASNDFDYDYNHALEINNAIKSIYYDYYVLKGKLVSPKDSLNAAVSDSAKNPEQEKEESDSVPMKKRNPRLSTFYLSRSTKYGH